MRLPLFSLVVVLSLVVYPAAAQVSSTGLPPFGSFESSGFDLVNRQNLNVHFAIPIVSLPGRGMGFSHSIVYDSLIWQSNGTGWIPMSDVNGNPTFGWKTTAVPG